MDYNTQNHWNNSAGGEKPRKSMGKTVKLLLIVLALFLLLDAVLLMLFLQKKGRAKSYQEKIALAEQYLLDADYDAAIQAYQSAIELDGENSEGYSGLADAYMERAEDTGRQELKRLRAEGIIEEIDLDDDPEDIWNEEILKYVSKESLEDILKDYDEAEDALDHISKSSTEQNDEEDEKEEKKKEIQEKKELIDKADTGGEEIHMAGAQESFEEFVEEHTFMAGESFEGVMVSDNGHFVDYQGSKEQDAITWYIYDLDDDGTEELLFLTESDDGMLGVQVYEMQEDGSVHMQAELELEISAFITAEEGYEECFLYQAFGQTVIGIGSYGLVSYYADGSMYYYQAVYYDGEKLDYVADMVEFMGSSTADEEVAKNRALLQDNGINDPAVTDLMFGQVKTSSQVSDAEEIYYAEAKPIYSHEEFSSRYGYDINNMYGVQISEMTTRGNGSKKKAEKKEEEQASDKDTSAFLGEYMSEQRTSENESYWPSGVEVFELYLNDSGQLELYRGLYYSTTGTTQYITYDSYEIDGNTLTAHYTQVRDYYGHVMAAGEFYQDSNGTDTFTINDLGELFGGKQYYPRT